MKRLDDNSDLLKILRCAFETYNTLKSGYLESVYEAALEYELLQAGFSVSRQVRIPVFYKGVELRKDFKVLYVSKAQRRIFSKSELSSNLFIV